MLRLSQEIADQELPAGHLWQNITARNGQESFLLTEETISKLRMRLLSHHVGMIEIMKMILDDHS